MSFLANRVRYLACYLERFFALSSALGNLGAADARVAAGRRPTAALRRVAAVLDVDAWLATLVLYLEHLDDRGEVGLVVSLNQKVVAGLRELEAELPGGARSRLRTRPDARRWAPGRCSVARGPQAAGARRVPAQHRRGGR